MSLPRLHPFYAFLLLTSFIRGLEGEDCIAFTWSASGVCIYSTLHLYHARDDLMLRSIPARRPCFYGSCYCFLRMGTTDSTALSIYTCPSARRSATIYLLHLSGSAFPGRSLPVRACIACVVRQGGMSFGVGFLT